MQAQKPRIVIPRAMRPLGLPKQLAVSADRQL